MKAITILQPWASLIACGAKKIEARSWATKYRGKIAIHAGLKVNTRSAEERTIAETLRKVGIAMTRDLPVGSVIAIAELVDCMKMSHKHIPIKHPMEYYDQPELSYTATVYADKEKTIPIGTETFTVPAEKFTRPQGGEFKETWICENEIGKFRDIGGDELIFGNFETGRYAWILENVRPIDPVPAKGKQRIWEWEREAKYAANN